MEIKVLDVDSNIIEEKIFSLGAKKVFDDTRVITYFSHKDIKVPFLKLTEEGEKLKLSSQNNETHEEVKLFVSRKEECIKLLGTLGYFPVSEVKARRISYELGSIDFDIDKFPEIPAFLEIDLGESPDISLEQILTNLGIEQNKKGQMSTPDIVKLYGKDYFEFFKISDI